MTYSIRYHTSIDWKSLKNISKKDLARIQEVINRKLTSEPQVYGKPMRHSLKGHWSLRIGDYRVIYKILEDTVHILAIGYRKTIYDT